MSILNTLKKALGIRSDGLNSVESPLKENYSGEKWTRDEHPRKDEEDVKDGETISEQIQDTPLFIRGNKEEGYYLIVGSYKVSERIQWLWKAREIADQTDWKTVMNVIAVMIETAFLIEKGETVTGMQQKMVKAKDAT